MKKVKTFLLDLSYSLLPQTPHYKIFLHNRFSTSAAFFFNQQLLFSGILFFFILTKINPLILNTYKESITNSLNTIPSNLEISIENGTFNSNLFRPFLFWIKLPTEKFLFLVIDEQARPEKIREYESSLLLSQNLFTIVYKNRLHSFSYSQFIDRLILNKSDILNLSTRTFDNTKLLLIIFFPILILLIPFSLSLISIIYLFLSSIFSFIFYRFFKKHYSFFKIFQIGIYSSSLPLFILIVMFSLGLLRQIPLFLPLIIFLLFQLTGIYEAHYEKKGTGSFHYKKIIHHNKKDK